MSPFQTILPYYAMAWLATLPTFWSWDSCASCSAPQPVLIGLHGCFTCLPKPGCITKQHHRISKGTLLTPLGSTVCHFSCDLTVLSWANTLSVYNCTHLLLVILPPAVKSCASQADSSEAHSPAAWKFTLLSIQPAAMPWSGSHHGPSVLTMQVDCFHTNTCLYFHISWSIMHTTKCVFFPRSPANLAHCCVPGWSAQAGHPAHLLVQHHTAMHLLLAKLFCCVFTVC